MKVFLATYLLLLLLALVLQTFVRRNKPRSMHKKQAWGKFVVFALIAPALGSVYFFLPQYQQYVHTGIALVCCFELFSHLLKTAKNVSTIIIALIFIALAVNFYAVATPINPERSLQLVSIYFTVVLFDSFSQLTGQLFGKHKMFPKISPNKTYAGLLGGALVTLLTAQALSLLTTDYVLPFAQQLTVVVLAFIGDTAASYTKRWLGIKDFSHLLPYQGGFIDRFDSYLIASLTLPFFSLLHTNF